MPIMRVGDAQSFVEFVFKEKGPDGSQRAGDVACTVLLSSDGFSGQVGSVWFSAEDIAEFLTELEQFEKARNGSVDLFEYEF